MRCRLRAIVSSAGIILSITSSALAQSQPPAPAASSRRGHLEIVDVLFIAAAAGAVAGRADGYCGGTGFDARPVLGVTALMAVISIAGNPNAYETRHPEIKGTSAAAATLSDLRARQDWHTRVEAVKRDGTVVTGALLDVSDDDVVLQEPRGRETIARTSIVEIDRVERDTLWDSTLIGAGAGTAWGLLWAHDCSAEDAVTLPPRGRMMLLGGVVMGAAGLVVDLLHKKRTALFRNQETAATSRVRVSPATWPNGVGVAVSWH